MPFLDNDVVVKTFGDKQWTLVEQLRYQGNQNLFTVPPNFNTDFASVPRVFVWSSLGTAATPRRPSCMTIYAAKRG